jgi:hypothetical protein
MKVDGQEFLEWLHQIREASERERKQKGVSGEEWLLMKTIRARRLISKSHQARLRRTTRHKAVAHHRSRVPV